MSLQTFTYQQQSSLADYCRTENLNPELQVRKDRVHHYRRLVFNVVNDSLQTAYPITFQLLNESEWEILVKLFFANHKPQSTQIWKMPKEFYQFVVDEQLEIKTQYPHLTDLLYFEWMEIEVFMMEDIPYPDFDKNTTDLFIHPLSINPEYRLIKVNYPVHLQKADSIIIKDHKDYYILLFRETETGRVQFVDLSPAFVLLIENLIKGFRPVEIIEAIAGQLHIKNKDTLINNATSFLYRMKEKGFILGKT